MEKLVIKGDVPLTGEVTISGAKNAAVAVIPAALMVSGVVRIENVPNISDVKLLAESLRLLGAVVDFEDKNTLIIDSTNVNKYIATYDTLKNMRGSYYLLGALLARFGKAEVPFPGGCNFGYRPIDQHVKGFEAMGGKVTIEHGVIKVEAERLKGCPIFLDVVSVGATINLMLAATLAEGVTTIENAAKEPHVVDVANFLNAVGANVKGAGTDVIKIRGVSILTGSITHAIIPDQVEAGTFMISAAVTKGDILVKNVIPKHMESLTAKLLEMNVNVEEYEDSIRVKGVEKITRANIKTLPYPGFPTDLHPQTTVLLCLAEGTSTITESVFDSRFAYVDELKRMGAQIKVEGRMAVVEGIPALSGAPVKALDLRAGAAVVLAALAAKGTSEIHNLKYIDRGYEDLEDKFRALGANIERVVE